MTYRSFGDRGIELPRRAEPSPPHGGTVDHRIRMLHMEVGALREIVGVLRAELIKAQQRITILESGIRPRQE